MSVGLDVVALARQLRDLNFDESTIVQICKQEREEHERKEKEERERKEKLNEVVGASIPDLSPSLTRCATMQLSGMKDGAMPLLTCRCRRACQCTFLENHFEVPRGHNLLDRLATMSTDQFSLLCYRYQHHLVNSDFLQTYLSITGHTWVRKASPSEAAGYLPEKPPSETPRISDINSNDKIFGIVVLPPSSHYLALEIVQQAEALLSPDVVLPQEGIHTDLISAYSCLSHVHATLRHEPYFSTVITPALHEHFVTTVVSPEQEPVRKVVRFSHQASIGSGATHADWVGVDSQWHPVVMGECKMERKHFDNFGGQVGNEVVRLGILPTKYDMRQERQHLFYPLTNINVCKDIVTAYLVLHVTRPKEVEVVADMFDLREANKTYFLAFLRLGSAKISTDANDQRAVWALLTACKDFVTNRLPGIIEARRGNKFQLPSDCEPFPCPDRGMKGWTCSAAYGPNVQVYERQSESWVIKHYDYWGRRSGALSTCLYQIAPTDVREPPFEVLEALGALEKTGTFYKAWVVDTLAEGVKLLRYPRVKTAPCGRNAHKQLASVVEQVQALHNFGIVHGDILLRNILFCNSWQLEDWMTKPPGWKMEDQTNDEDKTPSPSRAPSQEERKPSVKAASMDAASAAPAPTAEANAATEEATAEEPVAFLIDFDLSRNEGEQYVSGYNCAGSLKKFRHPKARQNLPLQKSHDGYALARVAESILVANGARAKLVKALEKLQFNNAIKLCNECTGLEEVKMAFAASGSPPRCKPRSNSNTSTSARATSSTSTSARATSSTSTSARATSSTSTSARATSSTSTSAHSSQSLFNDLSPCQLNSIEEGKTST
ncbi:uncharacterized protein MONBRDRAFT_12403 [Monosiga brevicollis MX1]|uniref:Protein kinase domain-containing protein n=1 Tax=Monosiga brevicollis TaxID=81824 RepID=A9VC60_MONBE|nr:uncharacterized protein MONBRDRAFT_12403 [Monosiga brevicollis MX1]EDQ84842.1 predicted protein [Monosiga brevicollis MX1]|eukprot:XP_001750343.1 hypothetical protein [Monosiga brevicollis MX1]